MSATSTVDPNLPNDNRAKPDLVVFNLILGVLGIVIVILREYTRLWLKKTRGWDDLFIVLGLICALGFTGGTFVQIYLGGFGKHENHVTFEERLVIIKANEPINMSLAASFCFSRLAIATVLLGLVKQSKINIWKIILYCAMVLSALVGIATILTFGLVCRPLRKFWNRWVDGECIDFDTLDQLTQAFAAFNIVVDFICAGLPFWLCRNLNLNRRAKAGLYGILCCGMVTAACSIGRIVSLKWGGADKTWDLVTLTYWSIAESYGAIIFASAPVLHQLWKHYFKDGVTFATPKLKSITKWSRSDPAAAEEGFANTSKRSHRDVYQELTESTSNGSNGYDSRSYLARPTPALEKWESPDPGTTAVAHATPALPRTEQSRDPDSIGVARTTWN